MVNIIVQLSKYLMILMITVYTYLCFSIFGYYDPDKKKRCLRKQNVLMFVMQDVYKRQCKDCGACAVKCPKKVIS